MPHIFLYFLKYVGDKYGVRGSIFGHVFGRSKNGPKNIAVGQESLICHSGILETLQHLELCFKTKKTKKTKNAILWALLDPVLELHNGSKRLTKRSYLSLWMPSQNPAHDLRVFRLRSRSQIRFGLQWGSNWGGNGKNNVCDVWSFFGYLYGKCV